MLDPPISQREDTQLTTMCSCEKYVEAQPAGTEPV